MSLIVNYRMPINIFDCKYMGTYGKDLYVLSIDIPEQSFLWVVPIPSQTCQWNQSPDIGCY